MEQQETQQEQKIQNEIHYDTAELEKLKYIKVTYKDLNEQIHEICTEVKFIGNRLISVYFKETREFYIEYPQDVILKFVTLDAMYVATAVLHEVKKSGNMIYFSIVPPIKMVKQQNRKYSRVTVKRSCVLVVTDDRGKSTTYLSKTVNLSASGVLISDLETMLDDKPVAIEMSPYDCYNLILFLEPDKVYKLFARYVRHDNVNDSHRYAFHYMSVKTDVVAEINKYVTEEQIRQLKSIQQK